MIQCMFELVLLAAASGAQEAPEGLSPEVWINEGDTDGDGLSDAFERRHGLDPLKAASFEDGKADEDRLDGSGRPMFEVQKAEVEADAGAGGDGGSGANCGLTGVELVLVLGLLALRRRR